MSGTVRVRDLIKNLKKLLEVIPDGIEDHTSLSDSSRKKLRSELLGVIAQLEQYSNSLDPIHVPDMVFDPSDPSVVGRLIARTLLERPRSALGDLGRFYGSGVYAIYYNGGFDAYSAISNTEIPIYVGKVDPASSEAITPEAQGDKLWSRLVKDHAKNIEKATNLSLDDFDCRYLVVKSSWQNTAESYLIDWFKPVWNKEVKICFGFGKHGDKAETRANKKSPWDTLHPGRSWAEENAPFDKSESEIIADIKDHYARNLDTIKAASAFSD